MLLSSLEVLCFFCVKYFTIHHNVGNSELENLPKLTICLVSLPMHMFICIGNDTNVTDITIPAVLLSQVRVVNSTDVFVAIVYVLLMCRLWDCHC